MLLLDGLRLMAVGMFVVFCFLVLLIWAMRASARVFGRFAYLFPEQPLSSSPTGPSQTDHTEIAIAVAAVKARIKG